MKYLKSSVIYNFRMTLSFFDYFFDMYNLSTFSFYISNKIIFSFMVTEGFYFKVNFKY